MADTKPKPFKHNLSADRGSVDVRGLADLAQAHPEEFVGKVEDLVADGKIRGADLDLRALFKTFHKVRVKTTVPGVDGERSVVTTSAFPLLMGSVTVAELNRAYEAVPTIGQELVTDIQSNKKFAHVVKVNQLVPSELRTKEGDAFPLISAAETFSVIGHNRKGFQLAITAETLEENDMPGFLDMVVQGGQFASEVIEEQTLSRVCDQNGSAASPAPPYVWKPQNSVASLYSTSAVAGQTQVTRIINNGLSTSDNLEAARSALAAFKNPRGRRIAVPMSEAILLVPDALAGAALKLLGSELEPGTVNEINNWGPRGPYRPRFLSSPKLDDISTSAWYMGAFKRQFRRKWKLMLETVTVMADEMEFLRTREAFRMRAAWDVEVGAIDSVFVVQNLAASTAPSAATIEV